MRKRSVPVVVAMVALFAVSAPVAANIPEDPNPLHRDWPWDPDDGGSTSSDCYWYPESPDCQEEPTQQGSCYGCMTIPPGPNGEEGSFHCDSQEWGYAFCTSHQTGCHVSGDCGSFQ